MKKSHDRKQAGQGFFWSRFNLLVIINDVVLYRYLNLKQL